MPYISSANKHIAELHLINFCLFKTILFISVGRNITEYE